MNRVRSSTVGVGAGHQLLTTLRRFAGVDDAVLVPNDSRTADAALLEARPMGEISPRSPAVTELRRYTRAHLISTTERPAEGRRAARLAQSGERQRSTWGTPFRRKRSA
jgi:Flp pilus assembly CpaE family ATPase